MTLPRAEWTTPLTCFFLEEKVFREREEARRAAVKEWCEKNKTDGGPWPPELRRLSNTFIPPGSMWFCPWYFDIKDPDEGGKLDEWIASAQKPDYNGYLSVHYLTTWARIRPPICVVCPDGNHWVPDAKSSNGTGWIVTGDVPQITCAPSIWTSMSRPDTYHGFLQNGVFTPPV